MSANTVYITSGGVNYYLSGGGPAQTVYAGSGTPWTTEANSPYELGLNGEAGNIWVPQAAPGVATFAGGAPLGYGSQILNVGWNTVTEQVGVQMRGTTKDNAIALLRQLRQVLNTALYSTPAILAVQSGTNTSYWEILRADIQETWRYLIEPKTSGGSPHLIRATITWVRTPLAAGRLSTGETLINAVTLKNIGTGTPNNVQAYSTGIGDQLYEGSPLNLVVTPLVATFSGASAGLVSLMGGSIYSRTYSVTGAGGYTTSSTSGLTMGNPTFDHSAMRTNQALKVKVLIRGSVTSGSPEVAVRLQNGDNLSDTLYQTPWADARSGNVIDCGYIPAALIAQSPATPRLTFNLLVRSPAGTSVTFTLDSYEILLYYTWCVATFDATGATYQLDADASDRARAYLTTFRELSNQPTVLLPTPEFVGGWTNNTKRINGFVRGTPPRYYAGASLYLAVPLFTSSTAYTGLTYTVTATHAPQFYTLRGGS